MSINEEVIEQSRIVLENACKELVLEWTRESQVRCNTDSERSAYESCAKQLHEVLQIRLR